MTPSDHTMSSAHLVLGSETRGGKDGAQGEQLCAVVIVWL